MSTDKNIAQCAPQPSGEPVARRLEWKSPDRGFSKNLRAEVFGGYYGIHRWPYEIALYWEFYDHNSKSSWAPITRKEIGRFKHGYTVHEDAFEKAKTLAQEHYDDCILHTLTDRPAVSCAAREALTKATTDIKSIHDKIGERGLLNHTAAIQELCRRALEQIEIALPAAGGEASKREAKWQPKAEQFVRKWEPPRDKYGRLELNCCECGNVDRRELQSEIADAIRASLRKENPNG